MPANRPATDRTQSLRPLFSWMTKMPPRAFGASAQAACSSPCGPAQVVGVVGSALADPGGSAAAVAGEVAGEVAGSLDVTGAFEVDLSLPPHAAISAVAAAVVSPSSPSLRMASRLDSKPST